MPFKILVDPIALVDIDETTLYIAEQGNPERARAWKAGLFEAIRTLREAPFRCAIVPEAEVLEDEFRHLHYHSHRIVFLVDQTARIVYVARVYHGARRALRSSDLG